MINIDKAEVLIETSMEGQDSGGNELTCSLRVLTDSNESAIEVNPGYTTRSTDYDTFYIPIDSGLVAMLLSMQHLVPGEVVTEDKETVKTEDPTKIDA